MSHPDRNNDSLHVNMVPQDNDMITDLNNSENACLDSPRLTHKLNSKLISHKRKHSSPVKRLPLQSKDKNVLTSSLKKQNLFQNINKQSQNWLNNGTQTNLQSNKLKKYGSILGLVENQEPIKLQLPKSKSIVLKDDVADDSEDSSDSENDLNPLQLKLQLQLNNRNKLRFDRDIEITSTPIDEIIEEPVGYTKFTNDDILKLDTYSSIDVAGDSKQDIEAKEQEDSPMKLLPLEIPLDIDSSDHMPQVDPIKKPNVPILDSLSNVEIFNDDMPQFEFDGLSNDDINDLLDDL